MYGKVPVKAVSAALRGFFIMQNLGFTERYKLCRERRGDISILNMKNVIYSIQDLKTKVFDDEEIDIVQDNLIYSLISKPFDLVMVL